MLKLSSFYFLSSEAIQGHSAEDTETVWWKIKKVVRFIKGLNNTEFRGVKDEIKLIRT